MHHTCIMGMRGSTRGIAIAAHRFTFMMGEQIKNTVERYKNFGFIGRDRLLFVSVGMLAGFYEPAELPQFAVDVFQGPGRLILQIGETPPHA